MNIVKKASMIMALLAVFIIAGTFGTQAIAKRAGGRHQGPPPEAYTACEGKSEGDTASFENRRNLPKDLLERTNRSRKNDQIAIGHRLGCIEVRAVYRLFFYRLVQTRSPPADTGDVNALEAFLHRQPDGPAKKSRTDYRYMLEPGWIFTAHDRKG